MLEVFLSVVISKFRENPVEFLTKIN